MIDKQEPSGKPPIQRGLETLYHGLERVAGVILRHWRQALTHLIFWLEPLVALFIVETLNEKNPLDNLNFTEWWMNLVLYVIIWLTAWLVLGRRRRAAAASSIFLFGCGLLNHYVLLYKGIILFPNDLGAWRTALNVLGTYDLTPDKYVWGAVGILTVYLLLLRFVALPQEKRSYLKPWWLNACAVVAATVYLYQFFFSSWLLDAGIKTQQWKTQCNGWLLNFSIAMRYSRVEKPEDYSLDRVRQTAETMLLENSGNSMHLYDDPYMQTLYEADTIDGEDAGMSTAQTITSDSNGTQPINILCIMDESFGDLSVFEALSTNQDAIPFYHSLTENTVKGWMYSPVTGGGTATVEYEFLTGNSAAFLPMGTVAYQLYVKDNMPSLLSWAKALGFETTTFHPYDASGWNRVAVYKDFGADNQLYKEDVTEPSYVRSYISDECDFEVLKSITEKAQGDKQFVFNVTMQNHGGYKQGWVNLPESILLSGRFAGVSEYTQQYLSLMNETDRALEQLLDYYSTVDEPTMIVFFGDHQGKISDWFYERLYDKSLDERDMEEVERQYVVPFFIWANYDIAEAQDVMISTNYLSALLGKLSNYPTTGYMDLLTRMYEELPVTNRVGYITKDGDIVEERADLPQETQNLLQQYETMSYYNLFQRESDIDESFFAPQK